MGKNKNQKKHNNDVPLWVVPVIIFALAVGAIVLGWALGMSRNNPQTNLSQTTPTTGPVEVPTFPTVPEDTTLPSEQAPVYPYLNSDLAIDYIGSYAGIFMEDGTDEVVSNALMMIVENISGKDLQLARIELEYGDFVANFEVTNLPAGERVVLLERSRHEYVERMPILGKVKDVVFFQEPMSLLEDKISITGGSGYIEVTNISGEDLTGELLVYYKNSASDLLYGGITYRARHSDGIASGETVRIMTNHYHPDRCNILMVNYIE